MKKFTLKAFKAVDNPEMCARYIEGHVKVLKDYGITNITSNNSQWTQLSCVYCVTAEDETGEMVGGIRIQKADGEHMLPVERAVGYMDPRIYEIVQEFIDEGVGELCALWNSKDVAGMGLSLLLTRAGISIANQVSVNIMMGICADYTMRMFRKVGFVVDDSLGTQGEFVYPNENYIARVLGILNARNLETAEEEDRIRMLSLRDNPVQQVVETSNKGDEVSVQYQLLLETT